MFKYERLHRKTVSLDLVIICWSRGRRAPVYAAVPLPCLDTVLVNVRCSVEGVGSDRILWACVDVD